MHVVTGMMVYTHYYPIANTDEGLRWRALLQFGESWHVLGSAVMKNPGSARFLFPDKRSVTDSALLAQLRRFDTAETATDDWYEFSVDSTMDCVGRLFAQHHRYAGRPLNGIIQIFNIFYVKEADLGKALAKAVMFRTPERMTDCDLANLSAPVYLGFSRLARHKVYGKVARRFFDKALELGADYLDADFSKNAFTHPQYLMLFGKNRPKSAVAPQKVDTRR